MTTPGLVDEDGIPVSINPISVVHTTIGASGITGATANSRYAGATASGSPASGTFAVGDYVIDQTGAIWICTVAGTPGTWVAPAGPAIFSSMTAVTLTDAATIAVNAALGNLFRVTLAGTRTLGAPSNPTDGQTIHFEIKQDATGSRTLAYASAYEFSTTLGSPTLTTTAGDVDLLAFRYNSTATKWRCLLIDLGFTS